MFLTSLVVLRLVFENLFLCSAWRVIPVMNQSAAISPNEGWLQWISNTLCCLPWLYSLSDQCSSISILLFHLFHCLPLARFSLIFPSSMLIIRVLCLSMLPNYLTFFISAISFFSFTASLGWRMTPCTSTLLYALSWQIRRLFSWTLLF